jgi:hypothetical protein
VPALRQARDLRLQIGHPGAKETERLLDTCG